MFVQHRWTVLALLTLLGAAALLPLRWNGNSWAGSPPARTVQYPGTPEPPLFGTPQAPVQQPRTPNPAPIVRPQAPDDGTPCPEDPPPPVVSIRVRVAATAAAGQELEYHLCVENRSSASAHHVIVRNPVPANARFVRATPEPNTREPELTWNLGTMEGCTCRTIVLVLTPTGAGDVRDCARVQFEHGQCVTTRIAHPALSLRKCGPSEAYLNETLTQQLIVCNTGEVDAVGVLVTDSLPPGLEHSTGRRTLTWDVGTLAAGQSRCIEYQVVARAPGRHCNQAVAGTISGLRAEAESCVTVAEARMTLVKTGPERRYVDQPATYQMTLTNTGTHPLDNAVLRDPVPPHMSFVSASNGGQLVGGEVQWSLGTLQPGANRTVEVTLRADEAGRICNRAVATAGRGLTAQAEACTEFIGVTALLLEVVDSDAGVKFDPIEVNAEARYVVLIRNQGTAVATNVRLDMLAPDQIAVTRVTGPADSELKGQHVLTKPFDLPARTLVRFTVYGKALKVGFVRFKVTMTADSLTAGPVVEEESTTIYEDDPTKQNGPR